MPGVGGIETTQKIIKDWSGYPPPGIISWTGNENPELKIKCLASGFTDFYHKDEITPQTLKIILENYG